MHLYISLKPVSKNTAVPIEYNYYVQSLIYSNLPREYSTFLHNEGYKFDKRNFKLFTFSRLLGKFEMDEGSKTITFPEGTTLVVSSLDEQFIEYLAAGLLKNDYIYIGEAEFNIEKIRVKEFQVLSGDVSLKTLSPVVINRTLIKPEGGKYTCYLHPGEPDFPTLLINNLIKKYEAFYNKTASRGEILVKALNNPKLNKIKFKGTILVGYTCRFKLIGPSELLQVGLDSGLGAKSSQGCGCVELIENES